MTERPRPQHRLDPSSGGDGGPGEHWPVPAPHCALLSLSQRSWAIGNPFAVGPSPEKHTQAPMLFVGVSEGPCRPRLGQRAALALGGHSSLWPHNAPAHRPALQGWRLGQPPWDCPRPGQTAPGSCSPAWLGVTLRRADDRGNGGPPVDVTDTRTVAGPGGGEDAVPTGLHGAGRGRAPHRPNAVLPRGAPSPSSAGAPQACLRGAWSGPPPTPQPRPASLPLLPPPPPLAEGHTSHLEVIAHGCLPGWGP